MSARMTGLLYVQVNQMCWMFGGYYGHPGPRFARAVA
jgi:hypothetical protein